jgi:hypothetical protein
MSSLNPQQTNNLFFILDNYNQCVIVAGSIGARTLSKLLKAMRLRRAVAGILAKISVPPGLPLNKSRSLPTHSESTLPQPLIPLHFISFRYNVYRKPGEGVARLSPKVLQLVTTCLPVPQTHTNTRNPIPLMHLLHNSRTRRGWGTSAVGQPILAVSSHNAPRNKTHGARVIEHGPRPHWSAAGTVAPQPAKCQNHASCSRRHRHQETYRLRAVSNVLRADIGCGIRRLPSPIARRSQTALSGLHSQEGLGPTF